LIKELTAIELIDSNLLGGSTKPWLIRAESFEGEIGDYVIKIFTDKQIREGFSINKEIFASILARQFDLKTPEVAFIKISNNFIKLLPDEIKSRIESTSSRVLFGSKYISSPLNYTPALRNKYLKEYDIETIFAFDTFIFNMDRVKRKPNLFFHQGFCYLIDHELSLIYNKPFEEYKKNNILYARYSFERRHIFLDYLKKSKNEITFDTFAYYLDLINLKELEIAAKQLADYGYDVSDFHYISEYIKGVKNDKLGFINILKTAIQL